MTAGLRVGIVGCGLIGRKRAEAIRPVDEIVGCTDVVPDAAAALARDYGGTVCADLDDMLGLEPDVVVIATTHDMLAPLAERALAGGAHVLVEKPAALGSAEVERLITAATAADRLAKVGFNHRFHPALARLASEVHSGKHGAFLFLRARYGHGGRPGYEGEWRTDRARSGGGELVDQGMHLLDLTHWIAGPLPLHSALLRTQFWNIDVEDNAAVILGVRDDATAPWAMLHVSWTEWKNTFSLEAYCRTAKLQVDGLVRSYGSQILRIYRMAPELGPPEVEQVEFPDVDASWSAEWANVAAAVAGEAELCGSLGDALYAWRCVEEAYA